MPYSSTMATITDAEFVNGWRRADAVAGWLTREQACVLWSRTRRLARGDTVVEIGSHQGRSTIILGTAARSVGATVIAIDPFVSGRLFGGPAVREVFEANVINAGLIDTVELIPRRSTGLRPVWDRPIDLLYIDGKHDYWTFTDDLRWSEHLRPDGDILVHDCFSSIGVTLGVLVTVLFGRRYVYLDRTGSLARLRRRRPEWPDRARVIRQLPWFARNVLIKTLLRLRLRIVARRLGHSSRYDPY